MSSVGGLAGEEQEAVLAAMEEEVEVGCQVPAASRAASACLRQVLISFSLLPPSAAGPAAGC